MSLASSRPEATPLLTHHVPDDWTTSRGDDVASLIEETGIARGRRL